MELLSCIRVNRLIFGAKIMTTISRQQFWRFDDDGIVENVILI